jgi:hypothetical protein
MLYRQKPVPTFRQSKSPYKFDLQPCFSKLCLFPDELILDHSLS